MRQKKAKAIRKEVYGDTSHKVVRKYVSDGNKIMNHPASPRARYQRAKRAS